MTVGYAAERTYARQRCFLNGDAEAENGFHKPDYRAEPTFDKLSGPFRGRFSGFMIDDARALLRLPPVMFAPFFAAGLYAAYLCPWAARIAAAAVLAAAFAALAVRRKSAAVCVAGALAGVCLMSGYIGLWVSPAQEYADQTLETEYTITEIISEQGDRQTFIARVKLGGRIVHVRMTSARLGAEGCRVNALVELSAVDERYAARSFADGVLLEGEAKTVHTVNGGYSLGAAVAAAREYMKDLLQRNLGREESALAQALLLGDTEQLSLTQSEYLRISGLSHYSAVSGTHFAVLMALLLVLLPERIRGVRAWISLAAVPVAAVLFGGSISVVRSAIMVALCFLAELFGRRAVLLNSLCVALTLICAVNPAAVLDAGFQMSVAGVFGAGFVGVRLAECFSAALPLNMLRLRPVLKSLTVSACAVICTSPFSIAYFGGVSLVGAVSSLIVAPVFTAAMGVWLLLLATRFTPLGALLNALIGVISGFVSFFGRMRTMWLATDFRGAALLAAGCAVVAAMAAFSPGRFPRAKARTFAALAAASMLMCLLSRETRSRVEFVSDGTSGAAVVCIGDEAAVLISGSGGNKLTARIAERLDRSGIHRVSVIAGEQLVSTGISALEELSRIVPVGRVYVRQVGSPEGFAQGTEQAGYPACGFTVGGVTISADKAGGMEQGDIVLYYGYKLSAPENNAGLALYASSRQKLLPENGVSIYGDVYVAELENADMDSITINER